MENRLRLFAVAVAATRLHANYKQSRRRDGSFTFRRRKGAEGSTGGPIEFRVAALAIVAQTETEAQSQGLVIAHQVMPDGEGWSNHNSFITEIASNIQTFQKGFG